MYIHYRNVHSQSSGGYADHIEYTAAPQLQVHYHPTREARNGIDVQSAQEKACGRSPDPNTRLRCREKLANMNQVICAFAYDDSRLRSGRWVGETDPNGDDVQVKHKHKQPKP